MNATSIKCPDCGAGFDGETDQATCTYCGTRLRFAPEPSATPGSDPSRGDPLRPARGRGASVGVAAGLLLGGIALLLFVRGLGSGGSMPKEQRALSPQAALPSGSISGAASGAESRGSAKRDRWHGRTPLLVHVDGDGLLDVIGETYGSEDELHLVAYSGADGAQLWRSAAVPDVDRSASTDVYLAGDTLVVTGPAGELAAFAARDGGTRWSLRLAEVAKRIAPAVEASGTAGGSAGDVLLLTADGRAHGLDLERGALIPAPDGLPQEAGHLPASNELSERQRVRILDLNRGQDLSRYAFEGLELRLACEARDGSFGVALGVRTPGTAVPELVRYGAAEGDAHPLLLWRSTVPGVHPLRARIPSGFRGYLDADAEYVATVYRVDGTAHEYRAVCVSMEDGRRLWDFEVPGDSPFDSVTVREGRVYVGVWSTLWVLRAVDGEVLVKIGE